MPDANITLVTESVSTISVAVVSPEGLLRTLLAETLAAADDFALLGVVAEANEALQKVIRWQPQVTIIDAALDPAPTDDDLARALQKRMPRMGIVLLCHRCRSDVWSKTPATEGGRTYLCKKSITDIARLERAIISARDGFVTLDRNLLTGAAGDTNDGLATLTPRQRQVLKLLAEGLTNGAIAAHLSISERTVQNQINLIYEKLAIDRTDPAIQPRVTATRLYLRYD